ncbi:MAG TPA: DUF1554 domain-containing protein [Turneriella sp.]|nr:DUF1554 domain-containing protein [Turneriella sp.]
MRLFLILAFMFPMSAFAAKKMLIMDFRNLDQDPNFQYLEGSITDAVKKLLREKFEFFEPEANDVEKRAQDSYFLFPEDYHNKNVALQLGLMTDQDIVISGGFQKRYSARGEAFILVDVMIFDIENKKLVRQFKNEIKVNAAIFESIDKLAQKVAQEAQEILPHKGQFEFDRYAPITQTQVTLLGGYNLNSFSSPMHKETVLTSGSSMSAADYGGMWIAAELRRDRFLDRNRLVGFFRADFQMINSQFAVSGTADRSSATGMGGAANFSVVLGTQPSAAVQIPLQSSDTTRGSITVSSLTFTPTDWNIPQYVTATGIDDGAVSDGSHNYSIVTGRAISEDKNYDGLDPVDVLITNADNDLAGVTISPTAGLTTKEAAGAGHTATFTVVLNVAPTGSITINLTSSNTAEGTVSPATLNFSTGNWNSPQTVTITGVADNKVDGNQNYTIITAPIAATGTNYDNIDPANVLVVSQDTDTAGFTIIPVAGLTTSESGASATFTVQLTSQPTANVQVTLTSDNTSEGQIGRTSGSCDNSSGLSTASCALTFTSANWNTAQTVRITGIDDASTDGNIVYHVVTGPATSSDSNFNGVDPADITLTNSDNDTPGITVSPTAGLTTTEAGGVATFTVKLNTAPTANVTLTLSSSNEAEGRIRRGTNCDNAGTAGTGSCTLVFTPASWNSAQTVGVVGQNDFVADGSISYSVFFSTPSSSSDTNYNGLTPASVALSNSDNDMAGVTVSAISGNTTESGTTATFTVVLTSQPLSPVDIYYSSSNTGEGQIKQSLGLCATAGTAAATACKLSFTSANWSTPQTVTVQGINDFVQDGNITYNLTSAAIAGSGADYNGIIPASVTVTNIDNDVAGFTVLPSSGLITTEAGGTATFSVRLNSQPTAAVTIGLSSSNTAEGTVSPASLVFDSSNWSTNQTVTVTGVADNRIDSNVLYSIITAAASSADPIYNNQNPADVSVTNNNSDVGKYIFVTSATYNGNFSAYPASGGFAGTTGADGLCNADAAKPNVSTYKAVIGSYDGGLPDVERDGSGIALDWALYTTTRYYRAADSLLVGTTDANGLFTFPLTNSFHNAAASYWTGLTSLYAYSATSSCRPTGTTTISWNASSTRTGVIGDGLSTISTAIANGSLACSNTLRLLCAEQ